MLYTFKGITVNNISCTLLHMKVYGYICLQGLYCGAGGLCHDGSGSGMGAGHPPCELISSTVEICLHFMVKYHYDIING